MSAPAAQAARRQGLLWGLVGAVVWAPALTLALRESDRLFDHAVCGADFASFHAASRLTLGGAPAQVYDVARHWAAQTEAMTTSGYAYFLYPPLYLLLCWPLGLAPFFVALASWLSLGFAACALALRRIAPPQGPLAGLPPQGAGGLSRDAGRATHAPERGPPQTSAVGRPPRSRGGSRFRRSL